MTGQCVLRRAVVAMAGGLLLLGMLLGTVGNLSHKSYLAAFLAAGLLTGIFLLSREKPMLFEDSIEQYCPLATCLLLAVLCLLLNGIWVFVFHPVQAPDYQTFFQAASDLANGRPLSGKDYIAMFPHILGYAAFLSVFLRLFGESVMTAALVNVVLTTMSGIVLFLLCLKQHGNKAAFIVFLLWILCPSKLLYNTMSLSEPFYTCLLLLFFFLASITMDDCLTEERIGKAVVATVIRGMTAVRQDAIGAEDAAEIHLEIVDAIASGKRVQRIPHALPVA